MSVHNDKLKSSHKTKVFGIKQMNITWVIRKSKKLLADFLTIIYRLNDYSIGQVAKKYRPRSQLSLRRKLPVL